MQASMQTLKVSKLFYYYLYLKYKCISWLVSRPCGVYPISSFCMICFSHLKLFGRIITILQGNGIVSLEKRGVPA